MKTISFLMFLLIVNDFPDLERREYLIPGCWIANQSPAGKVSREEFGMIEKPETFPESFSGDILNRDL